MFDTVLVANRGEIAVRVIRTLRNLGIRCIAVYSDADADAPHVGAADVAVRLGPAPAAQSYLSIDRILAAARRTGAQAIHPGYGFLSENTVFAAACADAGIVFVGPPAGAIEAMGDKIRAKQTVARAGVPVVPGSDGAGLSDGELAAFAAQIGFPVLLKPSAGGGGKGMREVHRADDLGEAIASARRAARSSFGDDTLLVERLITTPRHIEIQVLADTFGNAVHLGERECSLQRRHQKIVEEAPSALLTAAQRAAMGEAAREVARACGYAGAGTVEFIVDGRHPDDWFFMEMNTRLQVEHPVTEQVYGVDLVELQLRVAAGERTPWPAMLQARGHSVEVRVYAEDPAAGFLPTGGRILSWREPSGPGVRVDAGIATGFTVGSDYDPMLAKIIAYGPDRAQALRRLDAALGDTVLLGLGSNVGFLRALLADDDVHAGRLDTELVGRRLDALTGADLPDDVLAAAAGHALLAREPSGSPIDTVVDPFDVPGGWRVGEPAWTAWRMQVAGRDPVEVRARGRAAAAEVVIGDAPPRRLSARGTTAGMTPSDVPHPGGGPAMRGASARVSPAEVPQTPGMTEVTVAFGGLTRVYACALDDGATDGPTLWLARDGHTWAVREQGRLEAAHHTEGTLGGPIRSPMPGTVTVVDVAEGQSVTAGQRLVVVEAMKMEHALVAPIDGTVRALRAEAGAAVPRDAVLLVVEP